MTSHLRPKRTRMIHMVQVCQLVQNHIIAQHLRHLHQANVQRNRPRRRTTPPPRIRMRLPTLRIAIPIAFRPILQPIGQILPRLPHQNLLLRISRPLRRRVVQGQLLPNHLAIPIQKPLHQKIRSILRHAHLQPPARRHRKFHPRRQRILSHYHLAKLFILNNHLNFAFLNL